MGRVRAGRARGKKAAAPSRPQASTLGPSCPSTPAWTVPAPAVLPPSSAETSKKMLAKTIKPVMANVSPQGGQTVQYRQTGGRAGSSPGPMTGGAGYQPCLSTMKNLRTAAGARLGTTTYPSNSPVSARYLVIMCRPYTRIILARAPLLATFERKDNPPKPGLERNTDGW